MKLLPIVQTPNVQMPGSSPSVATFQAGLPTPFAGRPGYSWYQPGAEQPHQPFPIQPTRAVKFGVIPHPYCGVCPICVAGAAARAEVAKIGELRKGEDIEITVEEASQKIRGVGRKTGAKVGRTSIGNEDGTRLQPFSEADLPAASVAALPRIYSPDKRTYLINGSTRQETKGTDNGLYRLAASGQQLAPGGQTFDFSCQPDAPPPPMQKDPEKPLLPAYKSRAREQEVRTYGIYHHIAEGDEARFTRRSQPLLLGYAALTRLRKDELLVVSLRELPRFERLGVEAGGLMNVLGSAAKSDELLSVAVAVEPWQAGLMEYLDDLKQKYGFAVQELGADTLPPEYLTYREKAEWPGGTRFFQVPLAPLKATWAGIDKTLDPGEQDTLLLKSIEMPDAVRDGAEDEFRPAGERNLANCPPVSEMTFLNRPGPSLEGLELPEVPNLHLGLYEPD